MTSSTHETELAVFSYEEALANAESETVRELDEVADVIRYVAFIPELGDFCLCELEYRGERWFKRVRVLRQDERLPGEEISDEAIRAYAAKGRRVAAVLLYRAKYGVAHAEAVAAVKRLR